MRREVLITTDRRGTDDEELWVLVRGIDRPSVYQAWSMLCPQHGNHGVCRQMKFREEQDLWRNGKSWTRVAVQIIDRNEWFCSLPDMLTLMAARLQADYDANVEVVPLDYFLNS